MRKRTFWILAPIVWLIGLLAWALLGAIALHIPSPLALLWGMFYGFTVTNLMILFYEEMVS